MSNRPQNSLKEAERDKVYLQTKLESLCQSHKAETNQAKKRALKREMDRRRTDMNDLTKVISMYEDHLERGQRELGGASADNLEAQTPSQPPESQAPHPPASQNTLPSFPQEQPESMEVEEAGAEESVDEEDEDGRRDR